MTRQSTQPHSDSAIVLLEQPLSALTVNRPGRNYVAALASTDLSVRDLCLQSGSVSASTRQGSREFNLEGFLVAGGKGRILTGVLNGLGTSETGAFACRIAGAELIHSTRAGRDMRSSLIAASDALATAAKKNAPDLLPQTGTCLALAEIKEDTVTFSHLGNCRALLISAPGTPASRIEFASADHISTVPTSRGHVTRALTPMKEEISAQIDRSPTLKMNPGDLVILLSDGVTRFVSNDQIYSIVRSEAAIVSISRGSAERIATSNVVAEILFDALSSEEDGKLHSPGNQTVLVYQHGRKRD